MRSSDVAPPRETELAPNRLTSRRATTCGLALITVLCLAAGLYAARLNARFYERNQPFYDSMDYHTHVHRTMKVARESGVPTALREACRSSTVCLPLLIAALAGPWCEPSRSFGIALQTGELLVFAWSLFYYLRRVRGLDASLTVLAIVPFLSLRCLYFFNGGLSDFRMDLSLMLMFATTVLWYLIAAATERRAHYVALGLTAGAACLFRATAPVYLILALGPVAMWDLAMRRARWVHLAGLGIAIATAAAAALWFFVLNFDSLYYYYVVWNTDANANLPWRESVRHFQFVADHIGRPALLLALAFPGLLAVDAAIARWHRASPPGVRSLGTWLPDLKMLWIGLAPVLFLVVRGAGLNPFVSMPAVIGLLLFMLWPLSSHPAPVPSRWTKVVLAALALVCLFAAAGRGWKDHTGRGVDSMLAHRQMLQAMLDDAQREGKSSVRFATTHSFYLNQNSLQNVALFDMPQAVVTAQSVSIDNIRLAAAMCLAIHAEAQWREIPGETDEEKLRWLLEKAASEVDYLVIPDESTSRFLQDRIHSTVINRYALTIRERLLATGSWVPASGDIRNGKHEVVRLYRNNRLRVAQRH
jgi:hypothetical protein